MAPISLLLSGTRRRVLQVLAERPHTPTDLEHRLGAPAPAVRAHLASLVEDGLVERRGANFWSPHAITSEGRALLGRRLYAPVVTMAAGVLAAVLGVASWLTYAARSAVEDPSAASRGDVSSMSAAAAEQAAGQAASEPWLWLAVSLFVVAVVLIGVGARAARRRYW